MGDTGLWFKITCIDEADYELEDEGVLRAVTCKNCGDTRYVYATKGEVVTCTTCDSDIIVR